jgi:8-hydroxy-5-deazaflavin:NADPH oxidoreductase
MKIGILGTGMVGKAHATKLIELGHEVKMGSRTANNEKASEWVKANGEKASHGTFTDAAKFGEILFNCTKGEFSIDALKMAGAENLKGKVLIEIGNALDFSKGMPPTLVPSYCNTTSLGEEIQKAFPDVKVVKTCNTTNALIQVNPGLLKGDHDIFLSGDDNDAKAKVKEILNSYGWKSPIDLGGIVTSRGVEMMMPVWLQLWGVYKNANFNYKIVTQ